MLYRWLTKLELLSFWPKLVALLFISVVSFAITVTTAVALHPSVHKRMVYTFPATPALEGAVEVAPVGEVSAEPPKMAPPVYKSVPKYQPRSRVLSAPIRQLGLLESTDSYRD